MDMFTAFTSFLTPPILFFFMGMLASFLRVDLKFSQSLTSFLALYLLFSIGFHGGVELQSAGLNMDVMAPLLAAIGIAFVTPIYCFFLLRTRLNVYDSAAIAAAYGSVSAVTFITAINFLDTLNIPFGGHMIAAMALMEAPAIIISLFLAQRFASGGINTKKGANIWHETLLDKSVFILIGSLIIGIITGQKGFAELEAFSHDIFKGILCFFMLDMGTVAATRMGDLKKSGLFLIPFALMLSLVNAAVGIGISVLLGLSVGNALLFTVLCASASYIAVPAAMRLALPKANTSLYLTLALGITLPFNIVIGLPLYLWLINLVISA